MRSRDIFEFPARAGLGNRQPAVCPSVESMLSRSILRRCTLEYLNLMPDAVTNVGLQVEVGRGP